MQIQRRNRVNCYKIQFDKQLATVLDEMDMPQARQVTMSFCAVSTNMTRLDGLGLSQLLVRENASR